MWICSQRSKSCKKCKRPRTELRRKLRTTPLLPMPRAPQYRSFQGPGPRLLEVLLHPRLLSRSKLHTNYDEATRATRQPASLSYNDLRPGQIRMDHPKCLRSDSRLLPLSRLHQSKQYPRGLFQSKHKSHLSSSSHRFCKGQRQTNLVQVWNNHQQTLVSNVMRSSPCSQSKALGLKVKVDLDQPCRTIPERLCRQTLQSSDHV